ncbi:ATP-dependent RNA helicase DBP10 [Wallemia ichthyophaga EXF-994]|uniref:RNA helicase n=1 Tax=Wallemia ichthyophaga (strain EXF-994 / CBS 113033) TaxID=1299270 RepID=R9ANX8_WALI9|nr:ATP-dependent RNA helicase DBP10 [Wallemia ichthyophaga EXF-994]EOR03745.1 ATP-dependent RNA helicase DBP10 [Wallemia ichthyophaga EXF-994]
MKGNLDFMNSDDEDVDNSGQGLNDDRDIDISSALLPSSSKKTVDDDDDDQFILDVMQSANKNKGKEVAKELNKGKAKGPKAKAQVGGGSFQSMGLNPSLLRSLFLRGFNQPTPIQRQTIPPILSTPPRDLVGMARTGSGKTLAYLIPLVQKLGAQHSIRFGARSLILAPSRELALQILRVGKELVKGYKKEMGEGQEEIRWSVIVGGESLDDQFSLIASNPDVIIATPGRLLHLVVEMNLDLKSVEYVVFDEADRLFEMGFQLQLHELISRLPTNRQTLLFSATLPKTLVEFAKAGLVDPKLVRLDAESKVSEDLEMAFLSVKPSDKDSALLALLKDVIKVPPGFQDAQKVSSKDDKEKKRKKTPMPSFLKPFQTMIFTATKHHVEYLNTLLKAAGFAVAHIYGSLDQTARQMQMDQFRRGISTILVVTDVAARGIDLPGCENVINYDFPTGARIFVHRVGRTARAGRKGTAWSFITNSELPYLLDLSLFLARPLVSPTSPTNRDKAEELASKNTLTIGTIPRDTLDPYVEYLGAPILNEAPNLTALHGVMMRGHGLYERSQGKASTESYRRAKDIIKDARWGFAGTSGEDRAMHPAFEGTAAETMQVDDETAQKRADLLSVVNGFRPNETVFEIGHRGNNDSAKLMKERRKDLAKAEYRLHLKEKEKAIAEEADGEVAPGDTTKEADRDVQEQEQADEDDIEAVFDTGSKKKQKKDFRDPNFYMGYEHADAHTDKGYSLQDGVTFAEQARSAEVNLMDDEQLKVNKTAPSQVKWDKKKKNFVRGGGVGSDNQKLIKTESGTRLPATFKSGKFDEWRKKHKMELPRTGETEEKNHKALAMNMNGGLGGKKYRHHKTTEAKPLDKKDKNYEKKVQNRNKKNNPDGAASDGKARRGGNASNKKSEIKSVDAIRKQREMANKRKEKNARPTKKKK